MGYTTDFTGSFKIDRPVDDETAKLMKGIASTRRMKRNLEGYGVEGEFYWNDDGNYGQKRTDDIVDYNEPPKTQPGLWCQWLLQDDNQTIEWDGGEKFYRYTEWIQYLIESILKPRGYSVSGDVEWMGEYGDDRGKIVIENNVVSKKKGRVIFDD
jgi:hypothetical protein